jgi:hypothetical protein
VGVTRGLSDERISPAESIKSVSKDKTVMNVWRRGT